MKKNIYIQYICRDDICCHSVPGVQLFYLSWTFLYTSTYFPKFFRDDTSNIYVIFIICARYAQDIRKIDIQDNLFPLLLNTPNTKN